MSTTESLSHQWLNLARRGSFLLVEELIGAMLPMQTAKGGEFFGFLNGFFGVFQFGMEASHQYVEEGSILEEGTPEQIFKNTNNERIKQFLNMLDD